MKYGFTVTWHWFFIGLDIYRFGDRDFTLSIGLGFIQFTYNTFK